MLKKHSFIFPITFGKGILKSDTSVVTGLSYLNLKDDLKIKLLEIKMRSHEK